MGYNMSFIGDLIGDITGATAAGQAAERGAATQAAAAGAGIEEQRRQFDKLVELMTPYITAGTGALTQQQALIGLGGPEAERAAIERISGGETFKALTAQGEEALLQKASATGGLRGGNIQAALSQFRPSLLNSLIEQQYGRLGGLTESGRLSAAGQGASGMTSASNISNLFANQGAATAGGQIAGGNVGRQMFGDVLGIGKTIAAF
jgi:hypothetical protein